MFESRLFQNIFIGFLALVFVLLGFWGWSNGKKAAKSKEIIRDAVTITQGLEYFRTDQNRYPSTGEFENDNLMRTYITNFPPQSFETEDCPKTFDYYSATPQSYELRICLPKAAGGYEKGRNVLKY